MSKLSVTTLLSAAAVALVLNAPIAEAKKTKFDIELREWNITTSDEAIAAGEVDVTVKNKGKDIHELVFIKLNTDVATGRLPVDKDGGIDENKMNFGTLVHEIEGIEPGKKVKETITLKPGRYAVICNVVEEEDNGDIEAHYSMGMHIVLNVE